MADEYRYQCAHDHEWVMVPTENMRCPACGTTTLRCVKPAEGVEASIARELWSWNASVSNQHEFPYDDLIPATKDDLRAIARRILPHVQRDAETFAEAERKAANPA